MKTVTLEFQGNSSLVYAYFFGDDLLKALEEQDAASFDFTELLQSSQVKADMFLGKGLNIEGDLTIKISAAEDVLYEGEIHSFDQYGHDFSSLKDDEFKQLKEEFSEDYEGMLFENTVTHNPSDEKERRYGADFWLNDVEDHKYCIIEVVECYWAKATTDLKVDQQFKPIDIRPIFSEFDDEGLMEKVYAETGLESELVGFRYKNEDYFISAEENEGGTNTFHFFENSDDEWSHSASLDIAIDNLSDW